ncbi:allantoate permease [Histoplasma capsulatum G186AR]|uniref:Allantoate permease n=1 Tax=Ajellomyces capsulatus (strain G186AR / H82 / ATCC MYA-2454 / RMSCC 2432) TaxID=447093 RepID=C0NHN2_AJECG|nr:allantoate permease [Histoplasma capsulatum G186AR]EEH09317.1 allantoate permease [Histoplasma capsulatum G186AR]
MASARADSVPTAWAKDSSSLLERGAVRGGGRHVSEMQLAEDVVRKIDRRILPLLFVTYNFNFMDKVILSSASVFGLREDTHLVGSQYSWISSVFYFGYLFWTFPTSILIQQLPVGKYVSANTFFWGAVVALTAACSNFGGLMGVRFLLGVAEATISPAFVFVTSMWWTREEIPARCGVWFAGNSLGGLLSNFVAFGIGHIKRPLAAWQWLFIQVDGFNSLPVIDCVTFQVLGVATFLWGFFLLFLLPDTIATCDFLNEREKIYAEHRVEFAGTGKIRHEWKREQVIECLMDPKTFLFLSISVLTQIPNGGTQNFGNLVLKGFGFSPLETTLIITPASVLCISTVLITKYPNVATYLICGIVAFPVAGSAIIYSNVSKGVKLFGYYLMSPGPAALPLAMSLVAVNYKGSTKKMTMTAILFVAYCAGNIAGPQFFISAEAPHYPTAFRAILVCYSLVVVSALALRFYLNCLNRKRDEKERVPAVENESGMANKINPTSGEEEEEELTDFHARGFRYRT